MRKPGAHLVYLILSGGIQLANTLVFTVLAVYYVTAAGLSPLQLVLVGTVLEGTIVLFEVPTGVVADTFSRRLSVIIGMFVLGAAFVLEGSLPLFAGILLAEAIRGVGETFLSGALDAWLADEVGEAEVGRAFLRGGQVRRLVGLFAIPASAGLATIALPLPILLGGGVYLALGLFLALAMPEAGFRPTPRGERSSWRATRDTLRDGARVVRGRPLLLTLLAVSLVAGAASEGFDRLWEAHFLRGFAFPGAGRFEPVVWFGIIGTLASVAALIVTQLFRRRLEAVSRDPSATARVLLGLNALTIVSIAVFALAGNFPLALGAYLVKATADALFYPLNRAWLTQNIDPQVRATVLSMSGQANALGQTAGGPGVGAVGNRSLRAAIALSGLLLSPTLALYAMALRRGRPAPVQADGQGRTTLPES